LHAAGSAAKRKHPVLMRDQRVRTNQNSFDPTEDGGIGADPERQTEDCKKRKAGTAPKHSEAEAKVLQKRLHCSVTLDF